MVIVSCLPLSFVSVKTDFTRYVPFLRLDLVLYRQTKLKSVVSVHVAPFTSSQIHKPQYFCKVCVTVMLIASVPFAMLLHSAIPPTIYKLDEQLFVISYAGEIPSFAIDVTVVVSA